MTFVPWLFVLAGAVLLGIGIRALVRARRFQRRARRANAVVTRLNWKSTTQTKHVAFPVLRFELPDGRTIEAEAQTGTNPAPAEEGQPVVVLYEADDPTIVRLAGLQGSGQLGAGIMIAAGAGAIVIGTFVGLLFALLGNLE